jgi:hypothetical protein
VEQAVLGGVRPEVPAGSCPPQFEALMRDCWATDPAERPSMQQVLKRLQACPKVWPPPPPPPAGPAEAGGAHYGPPPAGPRTMDGHAEAPPEPAGAAERKSLTTGGDVPMMEYPPRTSADGAAAMAAEPRSGGSDWMRTDRSHELGCRTDTGVSVNSDDF